MGSLFSHRQPHLGDRVSKSTNLRVSSRIRALWTLAESSAARIRLTRGHNKYQGLAPPSHLAPRTHNRGCYRRQQAAQVFGPHQHAQSKPKHAPLRPPGLASTVEGPLCVGESARLLNSSELPPRPGLSKYALDCCSLCNLRPRTLGSTAHEPMAVT